MNVLKILQSAQLLMTYLCIGRGESLAEVSVREGPNCGGT